MDVFSVCFLSSWLPDLFSSSVSLVSTFLIYPRLKLGRGLSPRFAQTAGDFFGVAAAVEG